MKLRKWVRVLIVIIFLLLLFIIVKDIFTRKTITITEGKKYTCYGSIVKVCNGINYDIE